MTRPFQTLLRFQIFSSPVDGPPVGVRITNDEMNVETPFAFSHMVIVNYGNEGLSWGVSCDKGSNHQLALLKLLFQGASPR